MPGLIILLIIINDMITKQGLLKDVRTTTGKVITTGTRVVETGSGPNRSRGIVSYAEIKYTVKSGESYVFEHTFGLMQGSLEKGDDVPVLYLPDAHDEAMVNTFRAIWFTDIVIVCVSSIFIGAGILVYKVVKPGPSLQGDERQSTHRW